MAPSLSTPRLLLRGWQIDDAAAALGIYGHPDVARWLSPVMDRMSEPAGMRLLLQQWIAADARSVPPAGRWAIQRRGDDRMIGGVILLPLPPPDDVPLVLAVCWTELGLTFNPAYPADGEAALAITCITGGNFRLIERLLGQVARLLSIKRLDAITVEVVEAARETLVIGT